MLIAFKIENFAGINEGFSFIAENQKSMPRQVIVRENLSKKLKVLPCIGFTHTEKTSNIFKALYFIRQLVIRTNASLEHENVQKYLPLIEDTASFQIIFLSFTNYYQYCITLSKNEIISEGLYRFDNDNEDKDIFSVKNERDIFIRSGQEYEKSYYTKKLSKYDIMPEKNQTLLSLFKEDDEEFKALNEAHLWFRKTLLTMEDIDLIDYFAEKNLFEHKRVPVFALEKINCTAKEIQPFLCNVYMTAYFDDLEKTKLRIKFTENEISFNGRSKGGSPIKFTINSVNNMVIKFLTALNNIRQNMKYAVFLVEDFSEKQDALYAYLFIKSFLYGREEERSQLIFSSRNPYLLSKDIIRSDGLFFADSKLEKTQKAAEFESSFEWVNAIKNYLPKETIKQRKRKKIKTSDLILIAVVIFFIFFLCIK